MLYVICSLFIINTQAVEPKTEKNVYLKNLSSIQNNINYSKFSQKFTYQKTPYLIIKNHKISN